MKAQWALIIGLIFALLISIIAIINFESVSFNYIFGEIEMPLIIIILISAILGALTSGMFSIVKIFNLNREIKMLKGKSSETVEENDRFINQESGDDEPRKK